MQARLDRNLAEAAALARIDPALAAQLEARESDIAARLEAIRTAEEQRRALQALRKAQADAAARRAAEQRAAAAAAQPGALGPATGSLSNVACPGGGSITVDASLASNLSALLQAASAAGLNMCGGGYRDPAEQTALRRANCGTSDYAIYEAPSSACSPPTARPGTSMHEKGLAIDFTCGGGTVLGGSACFGWLEGHAGAYGLSNLPSSPGAGRRTASRPAQPRGRRRPLDLGQMSAQAPAPTAYHRWLGWHAPALRRLLIAAVVGLATGLSLAAVLPWRLAVLGGWNGTALTFLLSVAPVILGADGPRTQSLAVREDVNRDVARLLLLAASGASLVAVGFTLGLARHETGADRVFLVTMAAFTLLISWTVVNTVFTLRYAHLYYMGATDGIDFEGDTARPPDYRDFAYLAFTIGMTYQVSDTTLRDRGIRRTVLGHAFISYVFGVVIVAAGVNVVAGLFG